MRADQYLSPGTKVRLESVDGAPEVGVVVHCWGSDEIDAYDCYVAFYGSEFPTRELKAKPYLLRYAASSLNVVEPSEPAGMLRDTVVWLREQLVERSAESEFDRGYQMGFSFALETLKNQCKSFGLADDLGWMQPDLEKWLRESD